MWFLKKKASESDSKSLTQDTSRGATAEQVKRDEYISQILKLYSKSFRHKVRESVIFRWILLCISIGIIVCVTLIFFLYSWNIMNLDNIALPKFGAFATASVSILGSVYGILAIITKFFFPEKDEQFITDIVKAIQQNDLQNRQLNITIEDLKENKQDNVEQLFAALQQKKE